MKKSSLLLLVVLMIFSFTLIGCSTEKNEASEASEASESSSAAAAAAATTAPVVATEAAATEKPAEPVKSEFPMLPDATNVTESQGTLMYQTATSMTDTFNFYKKEFVAKGLAENEILTLNDATVSQLVFTGSDNGKSLIVQMTKLSDTAIAVSIRYE